VVRNEGHRLQSIVQWVEDISLAIFFNKRSSLVEYVLYKLHIMAITSFLF
jgi:hypothetical protein